MESNCPKCDSEFDAIYPVRYIEEGVTRDCETFKCGSFYVMTETGRQFQQTHDCCILELDAQLTAATQEVERLKAENERLKREMTNSQLHNAFE